MHNKRPDGALFFKSGGTRQLCKEFRLWAKKAQMVGCGLCFPANCSKTRIGLQYGRYVDAVYSLVVLEQGGYNARQGKCAAVKGVQQPVFFGLAVAKTQFKTVCLKGFKV